jgi:hypothetical protein
MPYLAHSQIWLNLPTHDSHLGYISKLTQKILLHTFPAVCWFHQYIIEAYCQSSCRRQWMINWALGEPARVNWPPHWDHHKNPQNPFKWPYEAPKNLDLDLGTLILSREMIFLIFRIFMRNLNGLCGFTIIPMWGSIRLGQVILAYTWTMVKIPKFLGAASKHYGYM